MLETKKPITRGVEFAVLDEILYERYMAVKNNPNLKITNRWDLSDCFYNTRKRLDAMGYDVSRMSDRRTIIHKHVKEWCDRRNLKRHQIGIFAADRAVMAFQGELYSVSFENYKQLAYLGVDIVLVEKEGLVNKLVPFTTDFGIAFVQSEGFIAEYGIMLAQEAKKQGVNVAILTDFDASGIVLSHKIINVIRIGADLKMLEEFNTQKDENGKSFERLDPLKLAESYNGADHWTYLENLSEGKIRDKRTNLLNHVTTKHDEDYMKLLNTEYTFSDGTTMSYLDFIKYKRIELNTIENEVQPERFWNWLREKLIETFPTRDYNRAITVPDYVLTDTMLDFNKKLKQTLIKKLENNVSDIKSAYMDTKNGFVETNHSLTYTNEYLKNKLEKDDKIQDIHIDLKDLIEKLDELNS